MNNITILPYSMFDDGSIEYKTFVIVTACDVLYEGSHEGLQRKLKVTDYAKVVKAFSEGKHYVEIEKGIEVQWD